MRNTPTPPLPLMNLGRLYGMSIANNAGDATNDIDFAAGDCADSTNVVLLIGGAMTKQLDAAWAAGTNAGGRMSAAAIANTTYHCFAILKNSDGSVDYGFDTSPTAPTMPSGYTYFRRIGSIIRASGAILAFTQIGDSFQLTTPVGTNGNNPGTSLVTQALTAPLGIVVEVDVLFQVQDATPDGVTYAYIHPLTVTDSVPAAGTQSLLIYGSAGEALSLILRPDSQSIRQRIRTNTSAQIGYRLTASSADHSVLTVTYGWYDNRGRVS